MLEAYQVKIQVVSLQVLQCFVETFLNIVRVVMCVPELASDLDSNNKCWLIELILEFVA